MDIQPEGGAIDLRRNIGQVPAHVKLVIGCEDPVVEYRKRGFQ
jgi:hypothetical protein